MGVVVIIVAAFTILGVAALGLVLAQKGATQPQQRLRLCTSLR